jgi:tetratricopeptide (TPR) repeat protein
MNRLWRAVSAALASFLLLNSAYLWAFDSPTIFYMVNVGLHLAAGVLVMVAGGAWLWRNRLSAGWLGAGAALAGLVTTGLGLYLTQNNTFAQRSFLYAHIGSALLLVVLGLSLVMPRLSGAWTRRFALGLSVLVVALPAATWIQRKYLPEPSDRIRNPVYVPASMEEEGGRKGSPFWPSSVRTNVGRTVPSNFFLDSEKCGECHTEIYRQWKSSVHHVASFNNQFYRKSIEHMQEVQGSTEPSQWCAACHDHAVLFSGKWKKPIRDQIDTPEAQAGLACVSCHAISHVDGSMGNAGFVMEYNELHDIAASSNPVIRWFDHFLTFTDPEPHRRTFMKPFMRQDSAEYCSTCHKVHLDKPVNDYRWVRGFNDYDNWQASGFGHGARSFYYPPQQQTCSGCHMPLVNGKDPAARKGMIHSHRFPGANTAIPHVNRDTEQLQATVDFLQSKFISVDIFAATEVKESGETKMVRRSDGPQLMSTFAVGDESESATGGFLRDVGQVAAPLNRTPTRFTPGSTVRVDVVVRTRRIGHFFPGGTVDAFDVWLELEGKDRSGRHIFWSGQVTDDGRGPVEPGAHFYRSYQLDGAGNPINKRNAWQTRSVLYVRMIPPGAADTAHYLVKIPKDVSGDVQLTAKLNYRKFSRYYTQYAYAGKAVQGDRRVARSHDSRTFTFDNRDIPKNVSGGLKGEIPDLPIVTLAKSETVLRISRDGRRPEWKPVALPEDRERWNDWGIGLLLQGDLKGAEYAFEKVIQADPAYADGPLNVARTLIQEGETERAKPYLERALQLDRRLERIHYFNALVQKADGDYEAALRSLETVLQTKPKDRVVLNQAGRVLFLLRDYGRAITMFQRALAIDPEDLQAHYNLMLAYRGAKQPELAAREETLFRRFKADESSQEVTQIRRLVSPEDNNERQMIHDHESVRLTKDGLWVRTRREAPGRSPATPGLEARR